MITKFISKNTFYSNLKKADRVITDSNSTRFVLNGYYYDRYYSEVFDEDLCTRRKCRFL